MLGQTITHLEGFGGSVGNLKAMLQLTTFSPLSVHQLFKPDDDVPPSGEFQLLLRYRYMLMKYTQTYGVKAAYFGEPIIRPLFAHWPSDENTYGEVNNTYMYGPNFKIVMEK